MRSPSSGSAAIDVAPEVRIEHVGRTAEHGLRVGGEALVRQRGGELRGARLQQLHLLDRGIELGALLRRAARARPRSSDLPAARLARARARGPSAARRYRRAAARDRRACRADRRAAARGAATGRRARARRARRAAPAPRSGRATRGSARCRPAAPAARRRGSRRPAAPASRAHAPRSRIGTWRHPLRSRCVVSCAFRRVKAANFACPARSHVGLIRRRVWGIAGMFTTPRLVAIALCAALNFAIGNVVYLVKLPIYLDSIGTILCALLIFPDRMAAICCAFIAGFIGVILSGLVINPFLPWFTFTVLAIALVSALLTANATGTFRAQPLAAAAVLRQGDRLRRHHRHRVGDRLRAGRGLPVRRRHRLGQRLRGRVLPQDRRAPARSHALSPG